MLARLLSAAPLQQHKTPPSTRFPQSEDEDEEEIPTNIVRTCAIYIDDHMNVFRWVPYIVGGVALGTIVKSIAMFRQFCSVSQIPKRFIDNRVQLAGQIRNFRQDGVFEVEHLPIANLLPAFRFTSKDEGLIKVKLAGINLEEVEAVPWITAECQDRFIWFRLLRISPDDPDTVECIMQTRNTLFCFKKDCFNAELVEEGLATVAPIEEFKDCQDKAYLKFMRQLRRAEQPKRHIIVKILRAPLTFWEYIRDRRRAKVGTEV